MSVQQLLERHAMKERITELEAQVERLKGGLTAAGVNAKLVERIAEGRADNWLTAVPDTTVDL